LCSWAVDDAGLNSATNSDVSFAGVLGIKVKIMLPWDPSGKIGPKRPLPDHVSILDPKDQPTPEQPYSEQKGAKPTDPSQPPM